MFRKSLFISILCGLAAAAHAQKVDVIMATLAPADSAWYRVMEKMGEDWKNISKGNVRLSIRAGGVVGDEPECVRRLRQGSIQAAGFSGVGLGDIDQGVAALQIPMMFDSYEELDYVRDRIAPKLEKRLEQLGFIVLYWGDAGWVQFFSTKQINNLNDLRKMKLFTWAGDATEQELWEANGFRVVPLPATEIINQLRTHGLDAVPVTAIYAETTNMYDWTKYMCDVKWAPLIGATIISKTTWQKIPPDQQAQMLASARKTGDSLKGDVRAQGDRAIAAMMNGKPGQRTSALQVTHLDASALADWQKQTEAIYPKMKGKMVPPDLFDEVKSLRDQYRATVKPKAAPAKQEAAPKKAPLANDKNNKKSKSKGVLP